MKEEPVWNGLSYHRPGSWWQPIHWRNWILVNPLVPNADHSQHTVCDLKWPSQLKSSSITLKVIADNEIPTFFRVPWAFYGAQELSNLKLPFISNEWEQIKLTNSFLRTHQSLYRLGGSIWYPWNITKTFAVWLDCFIFYNRNNYTRDQ
jgi:hypothetical protein